MAIICLEQKCRGLAFGLATRINEWLNFCYQKVPTLSVKPVRFAPDGAANKKPAISRGLESGAFLEK
jgi:hypothetical protein